MKFRDLIRALSVAFRDPDPRRPYHSHPLPSASHTAFAVQTSRNSFLLASQHTKSDAEVENEAPSEHLQTNQLMFSWLSINIVREANAARCRE